VKEYGWFTRTC